MKAVLFGSVAEGRERYLSDIDLFVLVKEDSDKFGVEKKLEEMSGKYEKLYGNTLNPYVLTEKEREKRKNLPLMKNIEKGERLI
jgi:predicted nucleotidyltransferase